ncbi:ArsR/SmtB family transcription factor [Jeotgalibacillus haloalkalitolerans]|uniref:Metalloregulator ArsR/SmtB family transcription factor n=1 Tax=Jeotgalibacillus haloalkalitolerans TaxID=3104292 RepID=A0ABU5KKV0_9BACL|nr:metalloregulator ArsR/SmtB family transcription factor [Jeotgalibacillus sp. HH7-29]MDZ5711893.1 metalloregulator ArsR/SmtB family transcription factor [Jeotgalibacillus sp. HH7-29]
MSQEFDYSHELADIYRLFGDRTRLIMAKKMAEEEWTVSEFVQFFGISQPLVSQHIKKLKTAKLITEQRHGKRILYKLNQEAEHYPLVLKIIDPLTDEKTEEADIETVNA